MQNDLLIKLKALHNNVENVLDKKAYDRFREIHFDPEEVLDLFNRYKLIRDKLKSSNPSLFNDLPEREVKTSGTTEFDGRGFITRYQLETLSFDAEYCINILSQLSTVEIPSMKITREGVFFAGQYFDALRQVRDIITNAKKSIIIIDGYIDNTILDLLSLKDSLVKVQILTNDVSPSLKTTAQAFNKQYGNLEIRVSRSFHDRFLFVDDTEFYHFGASFKNLGNRGFMFSRIEETDISNALLNKFTTEWKKSKNEVQP